ncbi:YARHG domain-containing protein [Lacrimispora indolis]|uniref:YARHG domain-containing protein n=1 Tax=Lacrimispora indolis TaxID=69825 RepID=UPI0009FE9D67|nr:MULTISPECIES: YARHG domain-containing protein [Lachnospiraceae]
MKPHPILSIVLLALSLSAAGCSMSSRIQETPAGETLPKTDKNEETSSNAAEPGAEEKNQENVTITTWSLHKYVKYSDKGALIYQWNSREPEVVIPDQPESQYLINRSLRENDQSFRRYDFIYDSEEYFLSLADSKEASERKSVFTFDYEVLQNDGKILSLRQNYADTKGKTPSVTRTYINSYDVETGRKITLSAISHNQESLKLALAHELAGQIGAADTNASLITQLMSSDLNNFALLRDGILICPDSVIDQSGSSPDKEYLIPYGRIKKELNDYGNKLMDIAEKSGEEPAAEKKEPDYVFPESSTEYLTGADLLEPDASVLRIARNEIYARRGRKFDAVDIQEYFNRKPWYHGNIDPSAFSEEALTETEKRNLNLIRTAEDQLQSKEITDSGVNLEPDRDYLLDLDGDGTCETVRWTPVNDSADWAYTGMELTVNGQKQACIPKDIWGNIRLTVLDLQKEDREVELHLEVSQDSDTISSFSFYRYQNGRLEMIGDLAGTVCSGRGSLFRQSGLRAEGDGILAVTADTPFMGSSLQFGCYYVDLLFSYKDGRLEEIPQSIYPKKDYEPVTSAFLHENPYNYYVVSHPFDAFKTMTENTPAFSAVPGETVCPIAWAVQDGSFYVLVMNEAGTCGWVKETPWDTDPDTAYYLAVPAWG